MFTIESQEKIYNEMVSPGVVSEVKSRSKIVERVKKEYDTIDAYGKFARQIMNFGGSQAYGARSNSTYPTPQEGIPAEAFIRVKRFQMISLGFDGLSYVLAQRKGSPVDPQQFDQQELFKGMADDMSRQLMGDGSGRIAQCNGAGTGVKTLIVDSPYWIAEPTKFFKKKRVIDVYRADGTLDFASNPIDVVTSPTVLTLLNNGTWLEDSWVFGEGVHCASEAVGKGEIMGLMGIISDADPPKPNSGTGLQGLPVGTYPDWKAQVFGNGGVKRPFVEDLLMQAMDAANDFGEVTVMLYTRGLRRVYKAHLDSFKNLGPAKDSMWGGWIGLPFYYEGKEIPLIVDTFIPDGHVLGVAEKELTLHLVHKSWITWEKVGGSMLQKVAGKNEYVSEGMVFANLGVRDRRPFFKVLDLEEP